MSGPRALLLSVLLFAACAVDPSATGWETLEPGLDLGSFPACGRGSTEDDRIIVIRADPRRFRLELAAASSEENGRALPLSRWAERRGLVVATNAGMYHPDYVRHVGLMVDHDHENNPVAVSDYKSVLAFNPKREGVPPFALADLEETSLDELRADYHTLVQNLRMVSHRRANVWSPSGQRWSTAALGVDGSGNLLFLFSRGSRSVHELNECLLRLPIDLARAQYLEGGPEASLLVSAGETTLEWSGGLQSGGGAIGGDTGFWPIPNVIGVVRIDSPAAE